MTRLISARTKTSRASAARISTSPIALRDRDLKARKASRSQVENLSLRTNEAAARSRPGSASVMTSATTPASRKDRHEGHAAISFQFPVASSKEDCWNWNSFELTTDN